MRCEYCEYYSNVYGDKECIVFNDNEITENNKGEWGCRYNQKTLDKINTQSQEEINKAELEYHKEFNEFMEKEKKDV